MSLSTRLPAICSKTVVFHATIVPCDMTNYYVAKEITLFDDLNNALTPEEYFSFTTLLMKIVSKKDMNIDGNHTIDIIHSVYH